MANPKIKWNGIQGKFYEYESFPITTPINPNLQGNYIFCKQIPNGWAAVYIGEGDLKTRTQEHIKTGCVIEKGATHIHAHLNDKDAAFAEETDLLLVHLEAYTPTGCNVKKGG